MAATPLTYKMAPAIYEKNMSRLKLLIYKPLPVLEQEKITVRKASKQLPVFSSLGLIIPFQPTMWDEKSIEVAWQHAIQLVQEKMKGKYSVECTTNIVTRLAKLFAKLNFNTHRKSLAVILTPNDEKLIYLSYPVKPVVFPGRSASLLDLAANTHQQPGFYYLVLHKDITILYEYNNKQVHKIYEQKNETCPEKVLKNAFTIIERLNFSYEKPVFLTGSPALMKKLSKSNYSLNYYFTIHNDIAPDSKLTMQSKVKEVTLHWNYWQSEFIKVKILTAQKAGMLIFNIDAVLRALGKCADGILLVDKHLKNQFQKTSISGGLFHLADEFMRQLEKFLVRGNRIEIIEAGLLKDVGGIALLQNIIPSNTGYKPYRHSGPNKSLY